MPLRFSLPSSFSDFLFPPSLLKNELLLYCPPPCGPIETRIVDAVFDLITLPFLRGVSHIKHPPDKPFSLGG